MLKATAQQIEALARLRTHGDYKIFEQVVREYTDGMMERLVGAVQTETIYRTQGGITSCRELLSLVNDAPETLRKLKER